LEKEVDATRDSEETFTSLANLDDNIEQQDLILMVNDRVQIFLNSIQAEAESEGDSALFLGALGYSRERDNYEYNIRDVIENITIGSNRYRDAVAGKTADSTIDLNQPVRLGDIVPVTLNRDERDDVIIFTESDGSQIRGLLLLSK